jgi:hypothetical protein
MHPVSFMCTEKLISRNIADSLVEYCNRVRAFCLNLKYHTWFSPKHELSCRIALVLLQANSRQTETAGSTAVRLVSITKLARKEWRDSESTLEAVLVLL